MATDVVTPEVATATNTSVETSTYVVAYKEKVSETKDSDGNVSQATEYELQFMTESAAEKFFKKEDGKPSEAEKKGFTEFARQTFTIPVALNDAGIAEVVPSGKERVKLFERGKSNKAYQIIRARMMEKNEAGEPVFQPVEGAISLTAEIAEETASRATTPEAKMEKLLDGVDTDTALALIAKLQARLQAQKN